MLSLHVFLKLNKYLRESLGPSISRASTAKLMTDCNWPAATGWGATSGLIITLAEAILSVFVIMWPISLVAYAILASIRCKNLAQLIFTTMCFACGSMASNYLKFVWSDLSIEHSPVYKLLPHGANVLLATVAILSVTTVIFSVRRMLAWVCRWNPAYCSQCGYDMRGHPRDARCPECGRFKNTTRSNRDIGKLGTCALRVNSIISKIGLPLSVIVIGIGSIAYCMRWQRVIPRLRGQLTTLGATTFIDTTTIPPDSLGTYRCAFGGFVPSGFDGGLGLLLVVPATDTTRLQLQLGGIYFYGCGQMMVLDVAPPVVCDLDANQVQWCLTHGIPRSLIKEFERGAYRASIRPVPSWSMFACIPGDSWIMKLFQAIYWNPTEAEQIRAQAHFVEQEP